MKRSKYSPEFKRQAVNLMNEGDKPITAIAKELGVKRSLLYSWKSQYKSEGISGFKATVGRPKKTDVSKVKQLEAENKRLKEENEILKKAASYFAKELV